MKYSKENVRDQLFKVMVSSNLSFDFFDNQDFHDLLTMLRSEVDLPSTKKMKIYLDTKLDDIESSIRKQIPTDRKVSIALDAWTSPNNLAFVAIVAFWINDSWSLQKFLIGFEHLVEKHTGTYIAKVVSEVIDRFHLKQQLYAVTTDSAGNNKTMADSLTQRFGGVEIENPGDDDADDDDEGLRNDLREAAIRISPVWDKNQLHLPCLLM